VLRSSSPEEQLDAVVRCGEVLTRYLAALSLASYAARDAQEGAALKLPKTEGGFSFGDFLSIVQCAANAEAEHPLKPHLRPGFAKQKQSGGRGPADEALVSLLELRNDLGHQLTVSAVFRPLDWRRPRA
jgi:hypothetical protein